MFHTDILILTRGADVKDYFPEAIQRKHFVFQMLGETYEHGYEVLKSRTPTSKKVVDADQMMTLIGEWIKK